MKSAVITGATGMIGSSLASLLLSRGYTVHAVVRPSSGRRSALPSQDNLIVHEVDLSDLRVLPRLIPRPCSMFFHLAWAGSSGPQRDEPLMQCSNVRYSLEAVEAAHELGCKVFVGAGSQAEYGQRETSLKPNTPTFPESAYGQAKLCAGQLTRVFAEQLGLRHEWARIVSVYGPGDGSHTLISLVIRKLLCGEEPSLTACRQLWDYLFVDDAAEALLGMAERGKPGETYVVGSGSARPLEYYVQEIRNKIDKNASIGFGQVPYAEKQVMYLCADITAMESDFGFVPKVSFGEGIERTIEWMRSETGDCG